MNMDFRSTILQLTGLLYQQYIKIKNCLHFIKKQTKNNKKLNIFLAIKVPSEEKLKEKQVSQNI
jgi:hypothetical protein